MNLKTKLMLVGLILLTLPLNAWVRDIGEGGGGGSCSTSCARQCPNGYWSSIGCLSNQCAYCPCSGEIPQPYCV